MATDPATFYETWPGTMNDMKARAPEIGRAFAPFFKELMKDGALPNKQKELVALGIAVAMRCEPCIFSHVEKCVKAGWTPTELMEGAARKA